MPVVLVGTLDTKGEELAFVRDLLRRAGLETLVIDAGSAGTPSAAADIDRERVFFRAGVDLDAIQLRGDRGEAVAAAARGVTSLVQELHRQGKVLGIFALGGSAGTTIGTAAMRTLPFGLPKVMVSTLASGQTRPYVGGSDIVMVPTIADLAGLNRLTRRVLTGAAHALVGMVRGGEGLPPSRDDAIWPPEFPIPNFARTPAEVTFVDETEGPRGPVIAATMFGVTTPCVTRSRRSLEALGCEVLVFHATGVGGQAMEGLIRDGLVDAVLDLTTTELADEAVGGVLSAGPDRLKAAVERGLPQVVSVGALDMVNFGPRATVPERFAGRRFHQHNPNVTLMRTTPAENAAIGRAMAAILSQARSPTVVLLPLGGVSALDVPGGPFGDPEADAALFQALKDGLDGHPHVRIIEHDAAINDPAFADAATRTLASLLWARDPGLIVGERLATTWATAPELDELAAFLAEQGLPTDGVAEHLDGYLLLRTEEGRLVGSAGLERHGRAGLLRSVAIAPDLRRFGLGSRLVATLLNRAAAEGIDDLFLVTKDAVAYFADRFAFEPTSRDALPPAIAATEVCRTDHCADARVMRRSLAPPLET